MIRRPPRSTQSRSSAASDVYKRQDVLCTHPRSGETQMEKDEGSRMRSRRDVFDPVSGSTSSGQTVAVRCTLHGFVIGDCNRSAHAMAVNVAEGHCSAWLIIMYGDVGLGKTHLL